ncbi:hypothetical protein TcasGA2_TC005939 [Tribolium castaneum]|uniref:Uncharacterized protein n=1 Tax=Tribolium castaneum TaxID=7070 RepID=D6WVG3_TRICA|nr:hypothetical protein TcasGA2_TC005939 [Tribolium castaneum]
MNQQNQPEHELVPIDVLERIVTSVRILRQGRVFLVVVEVEGPFGGRFGGSRHLPQLLRLCGKTGFFKEVSTKASGYTKVTTRVLQGNNNDQNTNTTLFKSR